MWEYLSTFILPVGFIPHGHCYLWKPGLVGLHVTSDALIAIAYYSIPFTLFYFVRQRKDLPFNWIFLLFGSFIIACGTGHLIDIWTLWHPTYWVSGFIKGITAFVSIATAGLLVPLVPQALALPSPEKLAALNRQLNQEILANKVAQEALKNSEERFRTLSTHSPVGIYMTDAQGGCIYANPQCGAVAGLTSEELYGEGWVSLIHPEDCQKVVSEWLEAVQQGSPHASQWRCQTPQGIVRWVSLLSSPIHSEEHELIGYVGTLEDITDRKQAEEELRLKNFALEYALEGIARLDPQGRYITVNTAYASMIGYKPEEVIGMAWEKTVHPDDQARMFAAYEQMLKEGKVQAEATGIRQDGSMFDKEVTMICAYDSSDRFIGHHCFLKDITGRKQFEKELANRAIELERSNAELEQFAYVASHDLQEPLRMVASYTQLLGRRYKGKLDADADEFIGYAVDGAKRMQVLINDLLNYSRVSTRCKTFEPTNCEAILAVVLKNLQLAIEDTQAAIAYTSLPVVMADASQLSQLFQNLIANALKFHSDESPSIEIKAEPKENEWLFSVQDNGIGISPEYAERIFILFQRLHTREHYAGTGIGLAICKKIVERHGGTIWVEPQSPRGSIFFFTLPMS